MTRRAFILSRPRDFAMATTCAHALYQQGWAARVLIDPTEWDTPPEGAIAAPYAPLGRMVGMACHRAMMAAIITHSEPGDIVAKFDCDIRLAAAAAAWLAHATTGARTLRLGPRGWGGCWSAPRSQVAAVLEKSATVPDCNCPESSLMLSGFHHTAGGCEYHPSLIAVKWVPGRPWPPAAGALTLPAPCPAPGRAAAGSALFDPMLRQPSL